jgi:TATA-binding protein-associated factor
LYEGLTAQAQTSDIEGAAKGGVAAGAPAHVFQLLQCLRKLCSHPALVLTKAHPDYANIVGGLGKEGLRDIRVAPKLVALKELLLQCGMGGSTATEDEGVGTDADGDDAMDDVDGTVPAAMVEQRDVPGAWADASRPRHRALIFAQLTATLDLVESDLFRGHLPRLKYLRMRGGQSPAQRFELVQQFNADESIECLLLTTHVGGLGLNLTGADTVIFLEHDYNPMQDLQAMDRAHRIGQTRVVNVYRIITEGTLEERIMGLQRFKLNVANTVVSQDNASLRSMEAGSVLDLVLLPAVFCLLFAVCCLLSAVCCLLSAVCCLLSTVCCLLWPTLLSMFLYHFA